MSESAKDPTRYVVFMEGKPVGAAESAGAAADYAAMLLRRTIGTNREPSVLLGVTIVTVENAEFALGPSNAPLPTEEPMS